MHKVFVTGGTGFVGANLVRLLVQQGYFVYALARANSNLSNLKNIHNVEIIKGDLNSPDLWQRMVDCQYLFHVAAHYSLWQKDKELLYQNNVLGTRNILAAANRAGIKRTVYTSSVAAIGTGESVVDETHQSPVEDLVGEYKKSKYWSEQEAVSAAAAGQDVVIVNPSTPIGPMDIKPTPTGHDIILRFLRRKMPAYINTGLNLIDVRDVAWGHLLALHKGKSGERYILGNENLTLKQILDHLAQITNLPAPNRTIPAWIPYSVAWLDEKILTRLGKIPSIPIDGVKMAQHTMYYDASKAVRELGLPQTPVYIALKEAVEWFIAHGYVAKN
ncbi:dihydroflavonol-4-reductase [Dulcicalothrix desertica PCC 7102]|uniref:Dihydroflavonol-4-reductase n=1 Tax=Dulcicalothrix desertica PCC 7102 TaxID=232991 RepID=A0A3S1BCJ6_9CYAN|nr:hopanoid-associated sugar epimerase [Dulcicalothrix desertica]RUT09157.1 dihydroflavonol-4-reductase [Dulcicalothrix desertica PCC 7102]TWH55090.1 dihydroflavonol-4-reductase [Dulcicalothrix desertica PCC 7102]